MSKRFPFTVLALVVILALFVALALFGLVSSRSTDGGSADATGQLEKVETYSKKPETYNKTYDKWYPARTEAIYEEITREHPGSDYALEAQKNLIISYRSAKRHDDVQQALDELVRDFSGHSSLPGALYEIARIYERSKEYEKANSIYQQIIRQYPESSSANKAQIAGPRIDVLSCIKKDENMAGTAFNTLTTNFPSHSELPGSLYDIARRYERGKRYEKAKTVYQQIIQQYPESSAAGRAALAVKRTDIYRLIGSEESKAVDEAVDGLIAGFPGHPDMSEALFDIAGRCEKAKNYEQAKSIHQQLIQRYPDSPHASRAKIIVPKLNIFSLIESADYSEAQTAVNSLTAGFGGHSHLAVALDEIARRYEWAGKYAEAMSIYQYIVQRYPRTEYAGNVQLRVPRSRILSLIDAGNDGAAQAEIDKLVVDFRGDGRVGWTLSRFAEQYYIKAGQLEEQGLVDEARQHIQQSAAIYETAINEFPGSTVVPEACYLAGNHYRKLGEYEKSAQYYQKVADEYNGYQMAWNAQFMIGRNYEELKESGALSKSEADVRTRAAYQQVIERYPDCKAAKHARRWLSQHN